MTLAFTVAAVADLPYIVDLEYKNKESLGFLPRQAIEERVLRQTVFLGWLNGDPFGYLLFDHRPQQAVHVLQACIQYDARRRLYGAALYGFALQTWQADLVTLKCAADLESNLFWQALGLVCTGVRSGGTRRGRQINLWLHLLRPDRFLFTAEEMAMAFVPAFQRREDCYDTETGFLIAAPEGFRDKGSLGKLAWSNRKRSPR